MATRKIKDAKDLSTNELIYFKGHAQATYMSNGATVEDAINNLNNNSETDPMFLASPAASITSDNISSWNNKQDVISDIDDIRIGAGKGATAVQPSFLATVATSGNYDDLSNKPASVTESTVSGWGFTKNTGTYSKPSDGIPKSDLSSDVQTILNNSLTKDDIYEEAYEDVFIKASGIVDENDYYYYLPSVANNNPNFTLATKSDINASLTKPANYQILYTTTDDSVIEFDDSLFDVQLVSNVYENGRGVITFNSDVLSIPEMVFAIKINLKTIIIPDSVTTIGTSAFEGCYGLTSVTIPNSVTTIGENAFYGCTDLTSVIIPDSVTTIGARAFNDCNSLTSVIIPDSVTTIADGAFHHCDNLISVTIGDSVTIIGFDVFQNCTNLTSVTIGDSVTTIGNYAFRNCTNLTSVYCKGITPPGIFEGTIPFDINTNLKIYVPIESLETYKSAEGWDVYSDKICSLLDSNSVKTINGESIVGSGDITIDTSNLATKDELSQKQDALVSGTNIKTINGTDILGSGDITISSSSTTPMSYIAPAANIPIPMNVAKVITSVNSTNHTFTLATGSLTTNPANISKEQKWEIVFVIARSLSTTPTITFNTGNASIYWLNGETPIFEVGKYYEVSFLNVGGILLGVCAEFSAVS